MTTVTMRHRPESRYQRTQAFTVNGNLSKRNVHLCLIGTLLVALIFIETFRTRGLVRSEIAGQKSGGIEQKHMENTPACPSLVGTNVCAPKLIIGGAMKCGTNEIMHLISLHPRVKFNLCPDPQDTVECTTDRYQGVKGDRLYLWEMDAYLKDIQGYANRLPKTDGNTTITVDKSPGFLIDPFTLAPKLKELMPQTKLVFVLCDPVLRLVSEFYHYHRDATTKENYFKPEFTKVGLPVPESLDDFLDILESKSPLCKSKRSACKDIQKLFLDKGVYATLLKPYLNLYKPEEILLLDMDAPPTDSTKRLIQFSGLSLDEYPWGKEVSQKKAFHNEGAPGYTDRTKVWKTHATRLHELAAFYEKTKRDIKKLLKKNYPDLQPFLWLEK